KAGPHTVSATDGTVTATTGLTVTAAGAATLTVSPATATIAAGQSQAYKAEAFDPYGNDAGDYTSASTFAVSPDGTCTSGTCTATKSGSHTVSATWANASGSAALTISPGPLASLVVTPTGVDIVVGQSAALTASGNDSYGNAVNLAASVTWSMSSGTPGTLSASSGATTTFHAAATSSGTGSIMAKSGSLSATVAVTVHPAAPTHLMATTNGRKVNMTWTSAAGDRGFAIYRQTGTGAFSLIALTQSTAYVDGNLSSGLIYQYYVVAIGAAGVPSSPSNTLSITVK
ncbi:MAG TPA: hypothetical protein VEQ67_00750, partial [Mycobacterium sp.]|nr:hypothetical protein [Mycobacterium sp.]